jgi:hypothetical protein
MSGPIRLEGLSLVTTLQPSLMLPVSPGAYPRKVLTRKLKLILLKHSSFLFKLVLKWNGATTHSIMTLSIRGLYVKLSIRGFYVKLSISDSHINDTA